MIAETDSILANLVIWSACLLAMATFAKPTLLIYGDNSKGALETFLQDSALRAAYLIEGGKIVRLEIQEVIQRLYDSSSLVVIESSNPLTEYGKKPYSFLVISTQGDEIAQTVILER